MFERFSERARRIVALAQQEATTLGHDFIGTEHLLLGLVGEGEGVAARALSALGITDLVAIRTAVLARMAPPPVAGMAPPPVAGTKLAAPPFTPRAKKVLELALREALQLGHNYIGTEHILLGIVREAEGVAAQVLILDYHVELAVVRQQVIQLLSGYGAVREPAQGLPDEVSKRAKVFGSTRPSTHELTPSDPELDRRVQALRLAIDSFDVITPTVAITERAKKFDQFLQGAT